MYVFCGMFQGQEEREDGGRRVKLQYSELMFMSESNSMKIIYERLMLLSQVVLL